MVGFGLNRLLERRRDRYSTGLWLRENMGEDTDAKISLDEA